MAASKIASWWWRRRSPKTLIWAGIGFCFLGIAEDIEVRFYLQDSSKRRDQRSRKTIGSLIDRVPAIRGGRPKIADTGVTVMRVAAWYKMGVAPEEIATQYGHLSLAQVHAALAYYHANPDEIEADLAREEAYAEKVDRESESRSP